MVEERRRSRAEGDQTCHRACHDGMTPRTVTESVAKFVDEEDTKGLYRRRRQFLGCCWGRVGAPIRTVLWLCIASGR